MVLQREKIAGRLGEIAGNTQLVTLRPAPGLKTVDWVDNVVVSSLSFVPGATFALVPLLYGEQSQVDLLCVEQNVFRQKETMTSGLEI